MAFSPTGLYLINISISLHVACLAPTNAVIPVPVCVQCSELLCLVVADPAVGTVQYFSLSISN